MFSKKYLLISTIIIAFFAGVQIVAAATWPTHDEILPTSSFNIPIETVNSQRVDDMCMEWNLSYAIYSGAELSYKVYSAPKSQHQIFTKSSRAYVYGQMPAGLTFPIVSNFIPKNGTPSIGSKIYIYQNEGGTFVGNTEVERGEISTQISIMAVFRSLNPLSTIRTPYQYFYVKTAGAAPITFSDSTFKDNFIYPTDQPLYGCNNYYIAYCGDGKIDKENGDETTDGQGGIDTNDGDVGFLTWNIAPTVDEVCDDGDQNGQPGKCKTDCTGLEGPAVNTGGATCTFTASPATIEAGQTTTLSAGYTSGASATFSPVVSGFTGFTSPTWNGSAAVSPTTTTTYTMDVAGANGLSGTSCTTTVTVTPAAQNLTCALSFSQNPVVPGQMVNVGWNVTNGNFVGTFINVSPTITGWPHAVSANESNGVTQAIPSHTGDYLFSFHIFNNDNTQTTTCTGLLHVVENKPAKCSLTTTTPLINAGQAALIDANYSNSVLTSIYPNISGLNFIYPDRGQQNIQVYPTATTTYTMIVQNQFGEQAKCGVKINVVNTGLTLSKQLVTNREYQSGDLVSFVINFSNNSAETIDNVILSDFLPLSLTYVSSQLNGIAPYTFATGNLEGHHVVVYSGFSLTPGQTGSMIIVGRFNGMGAYTLNNAFIRGDNTPTVYASALFTAHHASANATVVKTSNKPSYYPGEDAQFTIAVTNNGPDAINSLTITDRWPTSPYVTLDAQRSANQDLTASTSNNPYSWTYTGSIGVGQTVYLYLTGHISNNPAAIGTYTNNVDITYATSSQTYTGSALPVVFTVSTTPSSTMIFEKRLVSYGSNPGDPVVFELLYRNNGNAIINNYDVVDYWPGTLNFVSASPMPTTQAPVLGGTELRRYFTTPLAANATGKITINGTIK